MKTRNIYEVAALMTFGAEIKEVDRKDKQHQEFVLAYSGDEDSTILRELQLKYQSETLMVNAVKFAENIRKLKSIIHS